MSANVSPRKAAAYVRSHTAWSYRDWYLVVTCKRCDRVSRQPVSLVTTAEGEMTVGALLQRLRCSVCRQRPDAVIIESGDRIGSGGRSEAKPPHMGRRWRPIAAISRYQRYDAVAP